MTVKRKVRRSSASAHDYKSMATRGLSIIGGLALGTWAKNMIAKKDVTGVDLLGLDGQTSAYATPAIVTAIGAVGMKMGKSQIVKDVAMGVMVAGGSGLVNAVAGRPLVSLGATEDMPVVPMLPGIGDVDPDITYDQLPSENAQQTTYNPVIEAGDIIEGVEPMIL